MVFDSMYLRPDWMENSTNSSYQYDDYDYDYELKMPCPMSNNHSVEWSLRPFVHPIICILGLAGNLLVILTYTFYKCSKSTTDVYLLNLAVSDLLFVAALPLLTYNEQWGWPMGTPACKLLRGAYSLNLFSGMLLLACVSADRYLAIVHARRRFRLRSLLYGRVVCAVVWVLSAAFSLPTFLFYQAYRPSHSRPGDDLVCYLRFSDAQTALHVKVLVPSSQMALGFFLPLAVMVFCYSQVVLTLLRAHTFQRHRALRVVLAVVGVFLLCHLPYNVAVLHHTLGLFQPQGCSQADVVQVVLTLTETLAYLHCCLNPLLYVFLGVKFRNNLKKLLEALCCASRRRSSWSGRSVSSRAMSDTSYVSPRPSITSTSFDI